MEGMTPEMAEAAARGFYWLLAGSGLWFFVKHWREARRWAEGIGAPKRGPALQLFVALFQAICVADGLAGALGASWAPGAPGLFLLVSLALGLSGGQLPKAEKAKPKG